MDLEEAILQMDLLGHDFFIYVDVEDQNNQFIKNRFLYQMDLKWDF